jgi:two-component system chemotaxis response regulator CheY
MCNALVTMASVDLVLVVADVEEVQRRVLQALAATGFELRLARADEVCALAEATSPRAILVAEDLSARGGRALVLKLRAHPATANVPVLGLAAEVSLAHALGWMRLGAADVWSLRQLSAASFVALLKAKAAAPSSPLKAKVEAWARRRRHTGTWGVFRGTPLEGSISFVEGQMESASFCWLSGEEAFEHIIELEAAPLELVVEVRAVHLPGAGAHFTPQILLVEDDPSVQLLYRRQLERAGYLVRVAADGEEGLRMVRVQSFDLVVTDLQMPKLDGWALLRAIRADPSVRDTAVVLLSAHGALVDALKAARAGARAYLKKTGQAKDLVPPLELLLAGHRALYQAVARREPFTLDFRATGATWTLRTLAELDVTGLLELSDELGRYEMSFDRGCAGPMVAQQGSLRLAGGLALEALLSSRGKGTFTFGPLSSEQWPSVHALLDQQLLAMRRHSLSVASELLSTPERLAVVDELAALYGRVAPVAALHVLEAFRAGPAPFDELASRAGLSALEVESAILDLLGRGVLTVREGAEPA